MTHAAEACMIALSFALYAAYHTWFFYIRGAGFRSVNGDSYGLFNKGKQARVQFVVSTCDSDDTILGIQQARNALTGVAFLAGICTLLAQQVLSILLDLDKQAEVVRYSRRDPVTGGAGDALVGPLPILGVNFLLLLACLLAFSHSVRTYIHMGFFVKSAANKAQKYVTKWDAVEVTIQAQVAFTIGQRILFFFPVTALWLIGPTAMLASACITTVVVAMLDRFTVHESAYRDMVRAMAPHHSSA